MRRMLSFLLKAAISVLLLYVSLRRVDLAGVAQRLGALDLRWIVFVLITLNVQIALNAVRWREIVAVCGASLTVPTALRFTFIGQFFSQVLPSTVGGDAARIWLLARGGAGWPTSIYSVLIDRVVGVAVLAALVAACLPWTLPLVRDPLAQAGLIVIGIGALFAAAVFLALGIPKLWLMERWWITRHLATASRLAWKLCRSAAGLRVAPIAFLVHFLTVLAAWALARAVHASIDLVQTLFVVLPVVLLSTIPVSIAGWGVRESAMVMAFAYAGLPESDGLIVSLLYGAANLGVGAIGGLVWIGSGYRWSSVKSLESETLSHERSGS
jgi:glycosyltransferase 2 family protein